MVNSSFIPQTQKKDVNCNLTKVKLTDKILLHDHDEFSLVIEKLITALDKLDQSTAILEVSEKN